jgi:3-oxoacyl-[acyl-carrier-protein] synthase-1
MEWDLSHLSDELNPAIAAFIPILPPPRDNQLFNRILEMATHAIRECLLSSGITPDRAVLLLGIRESFRTHPNLDGRDIELLYAIQRELKIRFHPESCVIPEGKSSAFVALSKARVLLATGRIESCIVGGVDSLVNWYDFKRFSEIYQLKNEENSRGFIPGEGAAFVVVTCQSIASKRFLSLGKILGFGMGNEETAVSFSSNCYPTGIGLQHALEATIQDAQLPESIIDFRISDLNGEYYRGIEYMLGTARFYRTRREDSVVWFPASSVGETGAAIGALLIIVGITGIARGYAPGIIAMCEASSDTGIVSGCMITGNL